MQSIATGLRPILAAAALAALIAPGWGGGPGAQAEPRFEAPAGPDGFAAELKGDPARGRTVFQQCAACHDVGPRAKNKTGPHLNNLIGRPAAAVKGFAYSLPLTTLGLRGMTWSADALDIYLRRPEDLIDGTSMPHVGLAAAQARADLIAYLRDPAAVRPGAVGSPGSPAGSARPSAAGG